MVGYARSVCLAAAGLAGMIAPIAMAAQPASADETYANVFERRSFTTTGGGTALCTIALAVAHHFGNEHPNPWTETLMATGNGVAKATTGGEVPTDETCDGHLVLTLMYKDSNGQEQYSRSEADGEVVTSAVSGTVEDVYVRGEIRFTNCDDELSDCTVLLHAVPK